MRVRHVRLALVAVLTGALAACGATPVGTAPAAAAPASLPQPAAADLASCQGAPYLRLIGQDATALERELILRQVRLIRPGRPVTADFRAERLNFSIDAAGRINRISCG